MDQTVLLLWGVRTMEQAMFSIVVSQNGGPDSVTIVGSPNNGTGGGFFKVDIV